MRKVPRLGALHVVQTSFRYGRWGPLTDVRPVIQWVTSTEKYQTFVEETSASDLICINFWRKKTNNDTSAVLSSVLCEYSLLD